MNRCSSGILAIGMLLASGLAGAAAELDVPLEKLGVAEPAGMMRRYLLERVEQASRRWQDDFEKLKTPSFADTAEGMDYPRWDRDRAKLKTPDNVAAYQKRLREDVLRAIGGLPERTPLAPQITGTIPRAGYRVEKVLFQSQPRHYVAALFYVPDQERFKPPYPGVLVPCGHSMNGKAAECHQTMGALLALNGMAALVFDPIDQGERLQYLGDLGSNVWPTVRHTMIGMGSLLLGQNAARFEIWDGMRAIDYLQSRPEIDPQRIGCCGCSGGGTQTGYLMALDDRVRCAAPSCSCTTLLHLLTKPGAQDSEQNIFGQLRFGVDYPHWIMMRAPSPVLVCACTYDASFNIEGVWQTYRYAKRLYTDLGFPERLEVIESNAPHGYHITHREGTARWMSRWLLGKDQVIVEPNVKMLTDKECRCTPKGQVMLLPGARSAYDLNEDYENELAKRRATAWGGGDRAALLAEVRRLAGIRPLADLPKPKVESCGVVERDGFRVEKLAIVPESGIVLPALLFRPKEAAQSRVVLYLHDRGKATDAGQGGPIQRLVQAGKTVLAVDLRGIGQTRAAENDDYYSPSWQNAYTAYLLGRSCVGMRAEDVLVCARYAAEQLAGNRDRAISLVAVGNVGIPTLHAAALEPGLFESVRISKMLRSWSYVLHHPVNRGIIAGLVHDGLPHYDLPNLQSTLEGKLTVEQSVDAVGNAIDR